MQPVRLAVGILLVLAGCIWIGQGFGFIRGSSFMVDDMRWALIGAIVALVGLAITWSGRRRATGGR